MANLTIAVDDEVLKQARLKALEQVSSVNAVLREYLEACAGTTRSRRRALRAFQQLADRGDNGSGRPPDCTMLAMEPEGALPEDLETWARSLSDRGSIERLRRDVRRLPAPRSRLHTPERMALADDLVAEGWRRAGWLVERRPFEFTDVVGFQDYAEGVFPPGTKLKRYPRLAGVNILGLKEGATRDAVLVGAHHDTLRDSPGADDNTASVAALLELARVLAPWRFRHTLLLAAFDMEELHFFGSAALVRQLVGERRIAGAIIFESMAYSDPAPDSQALPRGFGLLFPRQLLWLRRRRFAGDWTLVVHRPGSRKLARALLAGMATVAGSDSALSVCDPVGLPVVGPLLGRWLPGIGNLARSDQVPFWAAGLPAVMVTDTANLRNPHYHRSTDTPETLDYQRLAAIVAATAYALARVAGQPGS